MTNDLDLRSWGAIVVFSQCLKLIFFFFSRDRLGIVAEKQDQSMHPSPNSLRAPSYFTPVTLYVFFPMRLCSLNHYILIQVPTHLFLLQTRDHSENFAFRDIESSLICLAACSWPFYLNSITAWPFFLHLAVFGMPLGRFKFRLTSGFIHFPETSTQVDPWWQSHKRFIQ